MPEKTHNGAAKSPAEQPGFSIYYSDSLFPTRSVGTRAILRMTR